MNRELPWRAIIAVTLVIAPWLVYASVTFGTPLPSTLQVKTAQFSSGLWPPFLTSSLDMLRSYVMGSPNFPHITPQYEYFFIVVFAFFGGVSLLVRPQWLWWSIIIWIGLYAIGYSIIGVPYYHWYSVPLLYGGIILTGLGAQSGIDFVLSKISNKHKQFQSIVLIAIGIAICLPLFTAAHSVLDYVMQPVSPVQNLYTNTGLWLHENTPQASSVGYFEIGFMGYYSDRVFVDPAGLVNFGTAEQVARRNFKWAYLHYKPDYLVINPVRWYERLGSIREAPWFHEAYREVANIEEDGYFDAPIVIYQKINGEAIPTP